MASAATTKAVIADQLILIKTIDLPSIDPASMHTIGMSWAGSVKAPTLALPQKSENLA